LLTLALSTSVAPPTAIGTFCTHENDFLDGSSRGNNESFLMCIDTDNAMYTTIGLGPPGTNITEVYRNQTRYDVKDGVCTTTKVGAQGDPPYAMPFAFFLMDNDSRGQATLVSKDVAMDGMTGLENWSHVRGSEGTMTWIINRVAGQSGVQFVRNTFFNYLQSSSGNRDFSGFGFPGHAWATPAPTGSFDIPAECKGVEPTAGVEGERGAASVFADVKNYY